MNKFRLRTILITVAATLATIFTASAQEQRLALPDTRMSVSSIFQEIRQQTYLGVAYRTDQIDPDTVVTLPSQDISLGELMELLTRGTDVEGVIDGDMIVFIRKTPTPVIPAPADGYVPTPLSQFRESLGMRPKKVLIEGDEQARQKSQEMVEIPMPMESYRLPAADYALTQGKAPRFALKTNLLYGFGIALATWDGGAITPNLAFEAGIADNMSIELGVSYNPWNWKGSEESNRKLVHMIIKPEFRYWLCERFDGHFFGGHLLYSRYNVGTYGVPLLFDKEYRYDGHALGAGVTYGYNWAFHKRWGLEFAIGAGFMWMTYDRYDCTWCGPDRNAPTPLRKWYLGPTNASVSLVFLIK